MKKFSDKINETIDYGVELNENVNRGDFERILSKYTNWLVKNKNFTLDRDVTSETLVEDFMNKYDSIANDGEETLKKDFIS